MKLVILLLTMVVGPHAWSRLPYDMYGGVNSTCKPDIFDAYEINCDGRLQIFL